MNWGGCKSKQCSAWIISDYHSSDYHSLVKDIFFFSCDWSKNQRRNDYGININCHGYQPIFLLSISKRHPLLYFETSETIYENCILRIIKKNSFFFSKRVNPGIKKKLLFWRQFKRSPFNSTFGKLAINLKPHIWLLWTQPKYLPLDKSSSMSMIFNLS